MPRMIFHCNFALHAMLIAGSIGVASLAPGAEPPLPNGDAVIRGAVGKSEIVIATTQRLAGAIHSLTFDGREFIDSHDHGRQLQSASNFNAAGPISNETFNPTEAGSRRDGAGARSTSRLLHQIVGPDFLQTTTQMAFWLAPGEKSNGAPAKNATTLSNHLLTKRVRIGYRDLPNVIQYDVVFSTPLGERHTQGVFEVVTGYMPATFRRFLAFNPATGKLRPLSDGPGEQPFPVVLATDDGAHAMGVYSPRQTQEGFAPVGYGRFRFPAAGVVKWNSVFRLNAKTDGIAAGEYAFRNFVVVGDLKMVGDALRGLHREFSPRVRPDKLRVE